MTTIPAARRNSIYKFMLLDHRDHLIEVKELGFETDELACERAKALYGERSPHAVEVWEGARFICRMNAVGLQFSPPPTMA